MPIVNIGNIEVNYKRMRSNETGKRYFQRLPFKDKWELLDSFQDVLDSIKNNFHINLSISNNFSIDEIYQILELNNQLKDLV